MVDWDVKPEPKQKKKKKKHSVVTLQRITLQHSTWIVLLDEYSNYFCFTLIGLEKRLWLHKITTKIG